MSNAPHQIVSFGSGGRTFNFRAAAVIIDYGRILLHRADYEDFWSLPGGRVEMLEDSREALRREMLEELGEEVVVGRLVWVGENFFEFRGLDFHEMGMYFEVSLPEGSELRERTEEWWTTEDNGVKICFRWFPGEEAPIADRAGVSAGGAWCAAGGDGARRVPRPAEVGEGRRWVRRPTHEASG